MIKNKVNFFFSENEMVPGPVSHHLHLLTPVKQQLIARISPKINAPMLKPGGLRANEHCSISTT